MMSGTGHPASKVSHLDLAQAGNIPPTACFGVCRPGRLNQATTPVSSLWTLVVGSRSLSSYRPFLNSSSFRCNPSSTKSWGSFFPGFHPLSCTRVIALIALWFRVSGLFPNKSNGVGAERARSTAPEIRPATQPTNSGPANCQTEYHSQRRPALSSGTC